MPFLNNNWNVKQKLYKTHFVCPFDLYFLLKDVIVPFSFFLDYHSATQLDHLFPVFPFPITTVLNYAFVSI